VPYILFIQLDYTRTIKRCFCNFPAGASEKCKHVAALIFIILTMKIAFQKLIFLRFGGKHKKWGKKNIKKVEQLNSSFHP